MTTHKPSAPKNADNPEQSRRFIDAAHELEAEVPPEDADAILRKVASKERAGKVTLPPEAKRPASIRRQG